MLVAKSEGGPEGLDEELIAARRLGYGAAGPV